MIDTSFTVQVGDIWQLGTHRLLCGDATKQHDVSRLFSGKRFDLCFTSPPYASLRDYHIGAFDWHTLMCNAFDRVTSHGKPDCHILINLGLTHKNRQVDMYWLEWLMHCRDKGWPLFGWYVWDKGSALPGKHNGRLGNVHEFVFHFNQSCDSANKWVAKRRIDASRGFRQKDGTLKPPSSPEKFKQPFKVPDSIIRINREYARGIHTANHPAVFPVALPEFIMQTWSQPGDIVYDPFCGSGTSLIAGTNLDRTVYACELDPEYCQLALERWYRATSLQPYRIAVEEEKQAA